MNRVSEVASYAIPPMELKPLAIVVAPAASRRTTRCGTASVASLANQQRIVQGDHPARRSVRGGNGEHDMAGCGNDLSLGTCGQGAGEGHGNCC